LKILHKKWPKNKIGGVVTRQKKSALLEPCFTVKNVSLNLHSFLMYRVIGLYWFFWEVL